MQPQLNCNWKKEVIGREISIRGQRGLSSKHLFLHAVRTSKWSDAASDVKERCEIRRSVLCSGMWKRIKNLSFTALGFIGAKWISG